MRHERRPRPAACSRPQGRAGVREGAAQPREEHDAPGEHGPPRDGTLQAHKGRAGAPGRPVEQRGAELLFLPSYSLDLSPIEEAFGKVKALLRREKARTKGALVEAIGRALDAVTSEDARGWFGHCGYPLQGQLP